MCGIGGKTIEEAKASLSYEETVSWRLYRSVRGPLNIMQRIDRGAALMAVRMGGGKMKDFMPWSGEIVEEAQPMRIDADTIEKHPELMKEYGIIQRSTSRKVAMLPKKVVDYKKDGDQKMSKEDRINRLKGK